MSLVLLELASDPLDVDPFPIDAALVGIRIAVVIVVLVSIAAGYGGGGVAVAVAVGGDGVGNVRAIGGLGIVVAASMTNVRQWIGRIRRLEQYPGYHRVSHDSSSR